MDGFATNRMPAVQVKAIRQVLGVTQQQLADEFNIERNTVVRWERSGCQGASAMALRYARDLHRLGHEWRRRKADAVVA